MFVYRVVKGRKSESDDPIKLKIGDAVKCIEESNPDGEWSNWIFCKSISQEGWVPSQMIKRDGENGVITEDYDATEFTVVAGEIYVADRILNGWIWGHKEGKPEVLGWVPLNCMERL